MTNRKSAGLSKVKENDPPLQKKQKRLTLLQHKPICKMVRQLNICAYAVFYDIKCYKCSNV